jgi:hypothetical protein
MTFVSNGKELVQLTALPARFGIELFSYAIWRLNHQTETTLIVSGMDRTGGNGDRHGHESLPGRAGSALQPDRDPPR